MELQIHVIHVQTEATALLLSFSTSAVKRYQATLSRNKLKIEELSGEGSQVDRSV